MLALPIKMFLRIALNIKYVWVTPWFNIWLKRPNLVLSPRKNQSWLRSLMKRYVRAVRCASNFVRWTVSLLWEILIPKFSPMSAVWLKNHAPAAHCVWKSVHGNVLQWYRGQLYDRDFQTAKIDSSWRAKIWSGLFCVCRTIDGDNYLGGDWWSLGADPGKNSKMNFINLIFRKQKMNWERHRKVRERGGSSTLYRYSAAISRRWNALESEEYKKFQRIREHQSTIAEMFRNSSSLEVKQMKLIITSKRHCTRESRQKKKNRNWINSKQKRTTLKWPGLTSKEATWTWTVCSGIWTHCRTFERQSNFLESRYSCMAKKKLKQSNHDQ